MTFVELVVFSVSVVFLFIYFINGLYELVTSRFDIHAGKVSISSIFRCLAEIFLQVNIILYSRLRWLLHLVMAISFSFFVVFYIFPGVASALIPATNVSLLHHVMGLCLMFSTLLLIFTRGIDRSKRGLVINFRDLYSTTLILLIAFTGLLLESVRFGESFPSVAKFLIKGSASSIILQYYFYIRFTHVFLVSLLVASIPFTPLKHVFTAPLSILIALFEKGERRDYYGSRPGIL